MKNVCIIFLLSIIISLTVLGLGGFGSQSLQYTQNGEGRYELNLSSSAQNNPAQAMKNGYLRIHIRADSNDAAAQAVKYVVRDRLVEYLTPLVAEYHDKKAAMNGVRAHLGEIAAVATDTLAQKGFAYEATAELTVESFPTRVYGEYTLPAGEYTALIVRLGSGLGDNWWCVVYPPLCFAAPTGENVIYKSKILEIIKNFQK